MHMNNTLCYKTFFFFYPLPLGCGVAAADTILLQPVLSWTSSFVVPMALMSRLTQSSLLRSSSLSSPGWYHLRSLSSYLVLVSPLYVAKPPQSCFPVPLCDTLYLQFLLDVFVSHVVSCRVAACPCAHHHFCHFQFLYVGDNDWHCLHPVQHSWLKDHIVYLSLHVWWYSLIMLQDLSDHENIPEHDSCRQHHNQRENQHYSLV